MKKRIFALAAALSCAFVSTAAAQDSGVAGALSSGGIKYIAAAIAAMSENAELSGKALPFVGLAEGICLWGFLVALLIIVL